jgi:hypothetical protein
MQELIRTVRRLEQWSPEMMDHMARLFLGLSTVVTQSRKGTQERWHRKRSI